ncbi:hypothetical protein [Mycolicibacterium goodii]|uniref:Uncharacterized protein n=1 Tax=Mycolicibacterium goodii TaxID=134601 RepID=A0A0K0XHF9_MYCGD|nr:hypothetical protein AFA91_33160 [Mycolicibacterium goodii]
MATTHRPSTAITVYDAALCAVFGALVSAAVMLAGQDGSWTQRATPCAQQIDAYPAAAQPVGIVAVTTDPCHP